MTGSNVDLIAAANSKIRLCKLRRCQGVFFLLRMRTDVLVVSTPLPALTRAEGHDVDLDIDVCAVVQCL